MLGFGKRDESEELRPSLDEVEEHSFDDLAKGLASSTVSRGKALKLVGAALLGSAAMPFLAGTAEAKKRRKRKKKHHKKKGRIAVIIDKCSASNGHICRKGNAIKCCPKGSTCCPSLLTENVSCCNALLEICQLGVCAL